MTAQDLPARTTRLPVLGALRDARVAIPLAFFAGLMAVFTLERAGLYLALADRFTSSSAADVRHAFLLGLRFDAVVACALTAPLAVLLAPAVQRLLQLRVFRGAVVTYCTLVTALVAFVCVTDFYFFCEFDERLDQKALAYLACGYVYEIVWENFPVVPAFLVLAAVLTAAAVVFRRLVRCTISTLSPRGTIAWVLVVGPLLVLGIRSSLGGKPINTAPAYFSHSVHLSQLSLNGLFTLTDAAASLDRHENLGDLLDLLPEREALTTTLSDFNEPTDTFVGDDRNPLRRVTDTGHPRRDRNVVIVLMESRSWHYVGALGGDARLSPELDALAAEGILMENCFAVGSRTPMGISGVVCGFPDLPGRGVITRSETVGAFFTLGHVLKRRGYRNMFIHGGQSHYDHQQAFLRTNGFDHLVFEDDFTERTYRTAMGWCDGDLYTQAHREFLSAGDRPFLAVLLTLSFHRPFRIPDGKVKPVDSSSPRAAELDAARYADAALGDFIRKARTADYFKNTVFVFVADHTGGPSGHPISPASYRIPFLVVAPGVERPGRRIRTVCSQVDVPPTVMALLGGKFEHCFFGSSVLDRPEESGRALMIRGRTAMAFMNADREVAVIPFGATDAASLFRFESPGQLIPVVAGEKLDRLRRRGVATLQCADALFRRGVYRPR